jgi:hypothetical protein
MRGLAGWMAMTCEDNTVVDNRHRWSGQRVATARDPAPRPSRQADSALAARATTDG